VVVPSIANPVLVLDFDERHPASHLRKQRRTLVHSKKTDIVMVTTLGLAKEINTFFRL
jgi:hypothetical protein